MYNVSLLWAMTFKCRSLWF